MKVLVEPRHSSLLIRCPDRIDAMASLLDSAAQFVQRTLDLKFSEELKRSLKRTNLQTFGNLENMHMANQVSRSQMKPSKLGSPLMCSQVQALRT